MKTIGPVVFALMLAATSGCQAVLKKMYGIKKPDIESTRSVLKKAMKFGLDTAGIATVDGAFFLEKMKGVAIPDAAVFDGEGNYIEYRSNDTACNAGLFQFIPALVPGGTYNKTGVTNLRETLAVLRDVRGNALKPLPPADFYILINWAVWTGKLNKDHVKVWEELAKKNTAARIHVVKVNLDMQEYWDKKDRDKVMSYMTGKK